MWLVVRSSRVAFSHSLDSKYGKETVLAPEPPTIPVGDSFSLTILTELQVELNKKLLEVKVAADCLVDYTKIFVAVPVVPVSTTSPTVPTIASRAAKAKDDAPSRRCGKRTIKLTAKAQAAAETLK